jgi:cytochrome c oxidase subunit 3
MLKLKNIIYKNNYNSETSINSKIYKFESHPFHLVDPSPWPFLVAFSLLPLLIHLVFWLHSLTHAFLLLETHIAGFIFLFSIINWWYDIIIEGTFEGHHTQKVQHGLRMGMILFIISEACFFFAFFWAFFHSAVSPTIAIGCVWPPLGIKVLNPWGLPFLNTLILLSSGVSVTWAHRCVSHRISPNLDQNMFSIINILIKTNLYRTNLIKLNYYRNSTITALIITIFFGILFTLLQRFEYIHATFTIADGIYGSTFYVTTGFHGLHVLIGTTFLIICFLRHIFYHFAVDHHVGLEAAIWYWHFVDIVWLGLFVSIYWWGS